MIILGPVICTLQFPSSTTVCIFNSLRRPLPDSHLRRACLPLFDLLFNYLAPLVCASQRWWMPCPPWCSSFWEVSLLPIAENRAIGSRSRIFFFCLFSCLNKPEAAMCSVYDDRRVYTTEKCSGTLGNGAPVPNIHYTSFMWQVFPMVRSYEWLGICWNAAFKWKQSLTHTQNTHT